MSGRGIPYHERIGQKFGKLTILSLSEDYVDRRKRQCTCRCDCGEVVEVRVESVISPKGAKSCGCARRIHGNSGLNRTYGRYKSGAKGRGYTFKLTREEFKELVDANCHYCGSEPNTFASYNGQDYVYNGIDRIDNSIGYESGNVVTCCITCNRAKNDLSYDEFVSWIRRLKNHEI